MFNNPVAEFVHILPSAGLYLTQHFNFVYILQFYPQNELITNFS